MEETTDCVNGIQSHALTFEIGSEDGFQRFRQFFLDTKSSDQPWVQLFYRANDLEWSEIDQRFSLSRLAPSLELAGTPSATEKCRFQIGENLSFSLAEGFRNQTQYELEDETGDFSISLRREGSPHPRRKLGPECLQIEYAGAVCERVPRPKNIAAGFGNSGSWFRNVFSAGTTPVFYHYAVRFDATRLKGASDSLVASASCFVEDAVEPMAIAFDNLVKGLKI